MFKRVSSLIVALLMALALVGCGGQTPEKPAADKADGSPKILKIAVQFAYPNCDPHVDYNGWYTSMYGVTETLFKLNDQSQVEPFLAESAKVSDDGLVWTFKLKDGIHFSNDNPVDSEMVIKNFKRLAEKNKRFAYFNDIEFKPVDKLTFTATLPKPIPQFKNDLASTEIAIIDVDNTKDFDNDPIGTGPFKIKHFEPEGTVTVEKNTNYWNGTPKIDGAEFIHMADDNTKLLALQNGEIDGYFNITAASLEALQKEGDKFTITSVPSSRLNFYILNKNHLDDTMREAITLSIDSQAIADFLKGVIAPTDGPFRAETPYGKVTKPAYNPEKAQKLLEDAGYTKNADGYFEKDGKVANVKLGYYAARNLDTYAVLMQEQLKKVGIQADLVAVEDPDETYIKTGDYDIALYSMVADKNGDPYYFIDRVYRSDSRFNQDGYGSPELDALINKLQNEPDTAKRAELANEIVQKSIDDHAFGYMGLFNKITVLRKGVTGYAETSPYEFYGITADTDIK